VGYKIGAKHFRVIYKSFVLHNVGQQCYASVLGLRMSKNSVQKVQTLGIDLAISQHLMDDAAHENSAFLNQP